MQKKQSLAALAVLALLGTMMSGCAQLHEAKSHVKDYMQLPANEIAAPVGQMQLHRVPDVTAEKALNDATHAAVTALLGSLEQPVSLTSPITVQTLVSLNPEIVNRNRFGSLVAGHVSSALTADGYTVAGKAAPLEGAPKGRATITGTYKQGVRTVTIVLEVTDSEDKKVIGTKEFTLPVDGALRRMLDS
jgi:hypothetical protein